MSATNPIPALDEEPDPFHTPPLSNPEPIAFIKTETPKVSATYFKDTKTLKVSITGTVDSVDVQSIRLQRDSFFKTGFKFLVFPTIKPSGLDAQRLKLTGAAKVTGVEIPTKTTGFDDKKVVVVADYVGSKQTYTAPVVVSDRDPEGKIAT
ncbi:hypothetical protein OQA88_10616 [Cercophora sp. LCS_1]